MRRDGPRREARKAPAGDENQSGVRKVPEGPSPTEGGAWNPGSDRCPHLLALKAALCKKDNS